MATKYTSAILNISNDLETTEHSKKYFKRIWDIRFKLVIYNVTRFIDYDNIALIRELPQLYNIM